MPDTEKLAIKAAIRYLARREHSRAELCRKLAGRFPEKELKAAVASLAKRGLQSDVRTAEQLVTSGIGKGYGPLKILAGARRAGLDMALLQEALDEAGADWSRQARLVLQKRFGESAPQTIQEAARRSRFLAQRGFRREHFRKLLCSC